MSEADGVAARGRALVRRIGRRRVALVVVAALGLIAAGLAGYLRPDRARAVLRAIADPIVLRRVETFSREIEAAAAESNLDPCLIAGIVYAESSGRPDAVSSADAVGLMQLVPAAASDSALRLGIEVPSRQELLDDPALNLRLGASHFAWTLLHEEDEVERALVAYNAGRAKLRRWIRDAGSYTRWREESLRSGSAVLSYARRVLEYRGIFAERGVIVPATHPAADDLDTSNR
jgi:soluble lytic murein transglycosylase-like protein